MSSQPAIIISSLDAQRLRNMLDSITYQNFPGIDALSDEIDRAKIVAPQEVPPTVVTRTSTVPTAPAGAVAVIWVELLTMKPVAGVAPKTTAVAPLRLVPVMTTVAPPAVEPLVGEMPVTVGGAT